MKKVLIINTVGFEYDGITSVILNYTKGMDWEGLCFFFLVYENTDPRLKAELNQLGETVTVPNRKKDVDSYIGTLRDLLKECFDVVHIHGNSGTMSIEVLLAKLCGVKNIIVHAHSTQTNHPFINSILKVPMMHMADTCIACSKAVGDWLYGKHPYIVMNNAIDLSKFRYSEAAREKYRTEFGVEEEFLIGHIGHFNPQKNHFFLIDVFYEFHKLEPNSKLLLISDGPRFEQVKQKVRESGLQDAVIFAGRRNDVAGIYSAMDLFILPSCWEGLPLTMVEAQANGLSLLVSDVITEDAKCTECAFYKPLDHGAESWAKQILQIKKQKFDQKADTHRAIAKKGFDIHREAEKLWRIYMQKC